MMKKLDIKESEIIRLFKLLEELNHLFHQPIYFEDVEYIKKFSDKCYPEIHDFYYNIVWKWLPDKIREEIGDGGNIDEIMDLRKIKPCTSFGVTPT